MRLLQLNITHNNQTASIRIQDPQGYELPSLLLRLLVEIQQALTKLGVMSEIQTK